LLTALFSALYWLSSRPWYKSIALLARPLPSLLAMVVLASLYKWVPHTRVPWRAAWIGATVGGVALTALNIGFQTYYFYAADVNVIYGSLTILLFFLVSLYVFWLAILLGSEASWVVGHSEPPPRPERIDNVVGFFLAIQRGGSLPTARIQELLGDDADELLARMADPPALLTRSRGSWRLARHADEISLAEIRSRAGAPDANGGKADTPTPTLATLAKQENSGTPTLRSIAGSGPGTEPGKTPV
jgi:membrane protein